MTTQEPPPWLDRLNALQAEAQQLAGRLAEALPADRRHSGRDASGSVEVTVGARGRVEEVRLRSDWRRKLDDNGGLARAVIEAIGNPQRERMSAFATVVAEPIAPPATPKPEPFEAGSGPGSDDAQRAMRETLTLLQAAQGQLDEAVRAAGERARRDYAGHDPGRHVTVRVGGAGEVRQIEADEPFLRRMEDDYVGRALNAAIADAYRTVDAPPEQPVADDALRELKALTDDPNALLRRLFGSR
ncbi:YbaB/EbfC family nucleoid-associated protein [Paractinoplanes durhamensis]|uniref:YbaB/EbfC DNA-binding family protein n=1 Tax=Paractinoplanes durhamensis TaxID=113563 RepID=A0ABQ3YVB5_9ACTN|nr:YbaB/EbfC family nucleoid-associated protein [Actinoplanes durhamensis]GIE01535.1 hypothetical protein Adu01nite_28850 [Actinoplanes durhamensis]